MIKPLHEYVALRPIEPGKTQGGLHIPATAHHQPTGLVTAVGPKVEGIEPGDTVVFGENATGQWVHFGNAGDKVVLFRSFDILAVLPSEKNTGVLS